MSGFFRVPVILFDHSIYPQCFGLSIDAFKLYIYECSAIGKYGTNFCTHRASATYLGFDEARHKVAKKQLLRNDLVFLLRSGKSGNRFTSTTKHPEKQPVKKYWAIRNPPLVHTTNRLNSLRLISPAAECKYDNSAVFHIGNTPHGFIRVPTIFAQKVNSKKHGLPGLLKHLSPAEIDVYFNILFQCREYWAGVNPNYIRYELDIPFNLRERFSADLFLDPIKEWWGDFYVDPGLQVRTMLPISGFSLHDLRKTCNTLMKNAGVSPEAAMQILGHSTFRVNQQHYTGVLTKLQESAINSIPSVG